MTLASHVWKVTTERPRRRQKAVRVYVSLNKRGEIVMNEPAWKFIRDPASVTLLFYPEKNYIGVKYPLAIDLHFFMLRRYGRGRRNRIVRARRLLKQFGIEIDKTIIFNSVQMVNYEGSPMLLLDLGDTRKRAAKEKCI